jgi:hypothetical protein
MLIAGIRAWPNSLRTPLTNVSRRRFEKGPLRPSGRFAVRLTAMKSVKLAILIVGGAFDLTPQLRYWGRATVLP